MKRLSLKFAVHTFIVSNDRSYGSRKARGVLKRLSGSLIKDLRTGFRDLRVRIQKEAAGPHGIRKARRVLKRIFGSPIRDFKTGFRELNARIRKEVADAKPLEIPPPGAEGPVSPNLRPVRMLTRRISGSEGTSAGSAGGSQWGRVLVVGGMDLLGAGIVRQLNGKGLSNIVVVDDLGDGRWRNLSALRMERFLKPSELAEGHGRRLLGQGAFSHLFYLGGWGASARVPSANAILDIALQQECRFISLSSAEALGAAPDQVDVKEGRVEKFRPETEEGVLANLFDRVAVEKIGNRFVTAKYHQLFGPGGSTQGFNGLLLAARKQILGEGSVCLPKSLHPETESGSRKYDFLSLRRAAQMAFFLGGRSSAAGVFELGSGVGHTVVELLEALFLAMGRKPAFVWDRQNDQLELEVGVCPPHADLSCLRDEGWASESPSLEQSLRTFLHSLSAEGDSYWREELNHEHGPQEQRPGPVGRIPKNFKKRPFAPHAATVKRAE